MLAVTKCDLLDDELIEMLSKDLPNDLPCVFISAVIGVGIGQLKDTLWQALNSESNKLQAITQQESIVHANKDLSHLRKELEDEGEDEDLTFVDAEDVDDLEDFDELEEVEYEDV